MVEGGGGVTFPVIFFDGERDINIGDIKVNPVLEFKTFQLIMSQKIGISPNQISIYLYDRKTGQRTPITSKVNFAVVVRQKDCFFHVILKRSRKSKARRLRTSGYDYGDYLMDGDYSPSSPPENVILLRRNQPEINMNMNVMPVPDYLGPPFYDQITQADLAGLNDRLQNLKFHRENFVSAMAKQPSFLNQNLVATAAPPDFNPLYDSKSFPRVQETMTKNAKDGSYNKVLVCKNCAAGKKNDGTSSFHHCVNDPVIQLHSARAGPVRRPGKASR